ncbi:MAG: hypothetical protein V7K53_08090 [Nostoc sp.]|uniref:hypothetical protein n=1 Tax=Nostoc sp. TaxID=1180 RepID=UPI002FFB6230
MVDTSFILYLFIQAYRGGICSSLCVETSISLQAFLGDRGKSVIIYTFIRNI